MSYGKLLVALVAAAVAIAFADSSIVVLALPELYGRFDTTIEGVAWVVTAYNVAVAVTALGLVLIVHRINAARVLGAGLVVFLGASIACAAAGSLPFLIGMRSVQGVGAALLLAGSLPVLGVLTGSSAAGASLWTLAGTLGRRSGRLSAACLPRPSTGARSSSPGAGRRSRTARHSS